MGAGPLPLSPSWKEKLRRLLAGPFRFLLKDEFHRLAEAERTLEKTLGELRQAYLQTRGEFEEVRDRRLSGLEADFSRFQQGFEQLQGEMEHLRDHRLPQVERSQEGLQAGFGELQREVLGLRDQRVRQLEAGQERLQEAHNRLQEELEIVRDARLVRIGQEITALHQALEGVQLVTEEVRDQRLPAAVARLDAILERIAEELAVVRGLVDRILHREPLAVPPLEAAMEEALPSAVTQASLCFMEAHRGSRQEIIERAQEYLEIFRSAAPVLDLGCGRGELLQTLLAAGIEAFGVDADPAIVAFCHQLGLPVEQRDALEALRQRESASLGGVAMVHLVEHLPPARWMQLFAEARRVLRPGGILAVESPNPETLRVGGSEFWVDPTHVHPVHPQAARFVAEAVGLEVVGVRKLRPFSFEEKLAGQVQEHELKNVLQLLDEWLSGPRDYILVARKPTAN